ncbi:MAG: MGMT family protein [Endomicrobium sp.]|jgi:O-6-methylguanine DNA methyltransferase|nr:MGMT family protein [Endomicrobium sp.]
MKKIPRHILDEMKKYPPFYVKVWKACFEIPAGQTLTYGELAAKTGSPKAARAVGGAMRNNPWPPVIPCHRVVGSNGKMCGYSAKGGTKLKEEMLRYEKETGKDADNKVVSTAAKKR